VITVTQLTDVVELGVIFPLIQRFHQECPGLPYDVTYSAEKICGALGDKDHYVAIAHDHGKTLGYVWAQVVEQILFLNHGLAHSPLVSEALHDALDIFARARKLEDVVALLCLDPMQRKKLIEEIPRAHLFATKWGFAPEFIWSRRKVNGSSAAE
jgi:hypothetical protein